MDCLLLNLSKPPFNNLKVRQATAMAVSSAQYAQVIDSGVNPTSNGPFVAGSPYYVADRLPGLDVDQGQAAGPAGPAGDRRSRSASPSTTSPTPAPPRSPQYLQTAAPERRDDGEPQPGPAGQHHQHRAAGDLRGPGMAAVRGRRPRPQLHLLEPDPASTRSSPSTWPATPARPCRPPCIKGRQSTGPSRPGSPPTSRSAALMGADIPYIWTDRTVWSIGAQPKVRELQQPDHPGRGQGLRHDHRGASGPPRSGSTADSGAGPARAAPAPQVAAAVP